MNILPNKYLKRIKFTSVQKKGSEAYMKMVMKGLQSFAEVREKLPAVQE